MTRSQQISYLKAVAVSLNEYSRDSVDRAAKASIMKAVLILEKKISTHRQENFYADAVGLRRMKISQDTRHKLDLMVEYASNMANKSIYRSRVKEELKRLTRFPSIKIDEMFNEEFYLKRFHFIFR